MHNLNNLKQLPIINSITGDIVGRLNNYLLDDTGKKVTNLLVMGVDNKDYLLHFRNIVKIGRDAMFINNSNLLHPLDQYSKSPLDSDDPIVGKYVYTMTGEHKGKAEDVLINSEGNVKGIRISQGLLIDFIDGKQSIDLDDNAIVSDTTIIISGTQDQD